MSQLAKLCKHMQTTHGRRGMHTCLQKHLDKATLALRTSQAHTTSHMYNEHISSSASLKQCNVKDERNRYVVPLETIKIQHATATRGSFVGK